MSVSGWIGVDLDGTLAHYSGAGSVAIIGEPIPAMAERVRAWLAEDVEVRIVTARVAFDGNFANRSDLHRLKFAIEQTELVEEWTERHFGRKLSVTSQKDFAMVELWDDRAVTVQANTGTILTAGRGTWSTKVPPSAGQWYRRPARKPARWRVVDVVQLEFDDGRLVHFQGDLEEMDIFEWYSEPVPAPV